MSDKKIPIATAKEVAEKHDLRQCILIGWDGERTHIVTYGKTKADCEAAAQAQDFWKGRIREFSMNTRAQQTLNKPVVSLEKCTQAILISGQCPTMIYDFAENCARTVLDAAGVEHE